VNLRERILAGLVLLLVAGFGGTALFGRYQRALDARRSQVIDAKSQVADLNLALIEGRRALQQLESWQQRSLPYDREKALSLYKAWLLAKAKDAGLTVDDIDPLPRSTSSPAFTSIGYQLKAGGSISSVAAMLYEFYRSPQLHQVTRLQLIRPLSGSQLQATLDVEALLLRGATAADSLPEGDSKRLKLASLEEYQKSLSQRELASAYSPPRPPTPPGERRDAAAPPKFDDAELAKFSGTVGSGAGLRAWINVRTTGETLRVAVGDPLKVGALEGQVVAIEPRALVYASGEKKFRVALGQSLREGKEIEADPAAAAEQPAESPGS
jgi:hypothetical protein